VDVAGEHREGLGGSLERRHEEALHVRLIRGDRAVGVGRVVDEDEDSPHGPIVLEAFQLALVPGDLLAPPERGQEAPVRVEKDETERPVCRRIPAPAGQMRETPEVVGERRAPRNPIVVIPEDR